MIDVGDLYLTAWSQDKRFICEDVSTYSRIHYFTKNFHHLLLGIVWFQNKYEISMITKSMNFMIIELGTLTYLVLR